MAVWKQRDRVVQLVSRIACRRVSSANSREIKAATVRNWREISREWRQRRCGAEKDVLDCSREIMRRVVSAWRDSTVMCGQSGAGSNTVLRSGGCEQPHCSQGANMYTHPPRGDAGAHDAHVRVAAHASGQDVPLVCAVAGQQGLQHSDVMLASRPARSRESGAATNMERKSDRDPFGDRQNATVHSAQASRHVNTVACTDATQTQAQSDSGVHPELAGVAWIETRASDASGRGRDSHVNREDTLTQGDARERATALRPHAGHVQHHPARAGSDSYGGYVLAERQLQVISMLAKASAGHHPAPAHSAAPHVADCHASACGSPGAASASEPPSVPQRRSRPSESESESESESRHQPSAGLRRNGNVAATADWADLSVALSAVMVRDERAAHGDAGGTLIDEEAVFAASELEDSLMAAMAKLDVLREIAHS
jgi:hypothetical protein